ncbi:MAG: S8 family serine peptidase [Gammaproteobacteria bacterium]|nr:S8 family serine peptidase [Gammaproteobacteria bacterium]
MSRTFLRPWLGRFLLAGAAAMALAGCGNSVPALNDGKELPGTGAVIGRSLAEKMAAMSEGDTLEVVVTFHGKRPVGAAQTAKLRAMGLKGLYFRHLPIAGVVATRAQIEQLRQWPEVRSLWFNEPLERENEDARYLSSVDRAQQAPELVNARGEPITGKGVTILVNDSGVDGLHPDLLNKVAVNAIGHTDLRGVTENQMLPATPTECPGPCNSDFGGSHGTHVAGIAAGDGTFSGGKYAGAARGASLAAYGSGATLLVLSTLGGFDYALQLLETRPELNLRIVTNSFGSTGDQATPFNPDDPTNVATKMLADKNVIVVFSAGNSGSGPSSITGNYKKAPWILMAANGEKSGLLAPSSSRGALVDAVYEVTVDGEKMTVEDRPTVVTAGTNIVSARAVAADPFAPLDTADDVTAGDIPAHMLPYYTHKTGTSMAAPHLAGLTALLLEANPKLTWREAKAIFKATATNMPGYDAWEAGAGWANIEAALAMALELREDYGAPNHAARSFNAGFPVGGIAYDKTHSVDYLPAGLDTPVEFDVGPEIALVIAIWERPDTSTCSCSIYLVDPNGVERAASGVGLPVLAPRVAAVATGRPGKWKLRVRGLRSVSGVSTDPTNQGFGTSAPSTIEVQLQLLAFGPAFGLSDVAGHPAQLAIEAAVRERLMDGLPGGFKPDQPLTRAQFAEYLMAWGVRQTRAHRPGNRFADTAGTLESATAEAVVRGGQLIMDGSPVSQPLMPWVGDAFVPGAKVTREQVAYALVQASGRQAQALAHGDGAMTATDESGNPVPVADAGEVSPELRGHVQEALALKILDVEFFDDNGTRKARVRPQEPATRAGYATAVTRSFASVDFP